MTRLFIVVCAAAAVCGISSQEAAAQCGAHYGYGSPQVSVGVHYHSRPSARRDYYPRHRGYYPPTAHPAASQGVLYYTPQGYRVPPEHLYQTYPKFYGGFHYRHYSDLGVPPGDVGLRGNGIYMTPW